MIHRAEPKQGERARAGTAEATPNGIRVLHPTFVLEGDPFPARGKRAEKRAWPLFVSFRLVQRDYDEAKKVQLGFSCRLFAPPFNPPSRAAP